MPQYQIVYWRDIPAQVKVREGRARAGQELSYRFQEAIDEAAMRAKLTGTDDYLNQWRQGEWEVRDGTLDEIVSAVASEVEESYPDGRLATLVKNLGLE